jgi:ferredoxin-NADP reductase
MLTHHFRAEGVKAVTPAAHTDFLVRLGDRQEIAERTIACRIEKPPQFGFKPGQFIEVTLLNPPETDSEGNSRAFSIASAPSEDFLLVATRVRNSAFKRVLSHADPGTQVKIDGPFGDLRLHNDSSRAAVVLCGGIGITPFRSIILNATYNKLPHRIFLFYSNRRPEDAPFLGELQALEKQNPRFTLIACMTEMKKSKRRWNGEWGKISHEMLEKHVGGLPSAIYYVTGPPAFVAAMRTLLADSGVDEDNLRTEEFGGY